MHKIIITIYTKTGNPMSRDFITGERLTLEAMLERDDATLLAFIAENKPEDPTALIVPSVCKCP